MDTSHVTHDTHTAQAYQFALTWCRSHLSTFQNMQIIPCTSQLVLATDLLWVAKPTLTSGIEPEAYMVAWRDGQFALQQLEDFVLSIATYLEHSWQQRGYPDASFVCVWHPPMEDMRLPAELATADERDEVWVLEIATVLNGDEEVTPPSITTAFSTVWLRHVGAAIEIRITNSLENPMF